MSMNEVEKFLLDNPPPGSVTHPGQSQPGEGGKFTAKPAVEPTKATSPEVVKVQTSANPTKVETKPAEIKPAEVKPADSSKISDARRFAALAREERRIREREQTLREQRRQLDPALAEVRRLRELRKLAQENPVGAVKEAFGLTYDDLTESVLSGGEVTPEQQIKALKTEVDELRVDQQRKEQARIKEGQRRLYQQQREVISTWKADIVEDISAKLSDYKWTNKLNQQHMVADLIEENFRQTKKVMPLDEAAKLVENYIRNEVKKASEDYQNEAKAEPEPKQDPKQSASVGDGIKPSSSEPAIARKTVYNESELMRMALAEIERLKG